MMLITWFWMRTALALDCDFRPPHAPNGTFVDVPLNFRPFAVDAAPQNFWALYQDGEDFSVDADWYEVAGNGFQMIPVDDLLPNTEYQLQSVTYSDVKLAYLTTGTTRDEDAPSVPVLENVSRERSSSEWGDTDMMLFQLSDMDADVIYAFAAFSADASFSAPHQTWVMVYVQDGMTTLGIGQGLCDSTASSDVLDEHRYVNLTFYDWAGNVSDVLSIDTQYEQSVGKKLGCASASANATWWISIPMIGLFGRRRNG